MVFLLSPARSTGRRAQLLLRPEASFELACQVQIGAAMLGDVFTFCSGLYFRGKLAYARRFARTPAGMAGVQIITPSRGLQPADLPIGMRELREFSEVLVASNETRFTEPLKISAQALSKQGKSDVVLLGSIATGKYVETLLPVFGNRLLFPSEFIGRGDLSRGGLLLRCVRSGLELNYTTVAGAVRRGRRPPRLSRAR